MYATLRRRWPVTVLVLVVLVVAATTVTVVALERQSPAAAATPGAAGPVPASAIFTDSCRLTTVANNDPLLSPGRPGVAMRHDFFGNTGVTASSTASSLVGGATTCSTSADASAYWTPVLSQDGRALTPTRTLIYWRTPGADAATTHPMPAGISMIAGDENATAPQGANIRWDCGSAGTTSKASDTPQSCAAGGQVRLVVTFPSCWNGSSLAGAAQTNVVYPDGNVCPAGHPVRIPTIVFHEVYPTASAAGLTLSMGPGMQGSTDTAHADFVDGWNQTAFDRAFATCVTGGRACGGVTGTDATPAHPQDLTSPRRTTRHAQHQHTGAAV
jgi:hypothetical protein